LRVSGKPELNRTPAIAFGDCGRLMTLRVADVSMLQGLGDQQLSKHFHYEILFLIQPIKRDFGARLWVLVKEKRKPLQDQMSNFGHNP